MNLHKLGHIAQNWLPPVAYQGLRTLRPNRIRFNGDYADWETAARSCTGYDAASILNKVLDATLKVQRGEAAFERDSVLFRDPEYSWPVLTGLMWAAARNRGILNVLDFGGALGSSYFQCARFLDAVPDVRWNVVEQQGFVAAGRAHIQDNRLRFYFDIEECIAENKPNAVLLSSVLQYLREPFVLLKQVIDLASDILVLDRTPYTNSGHSSVLKVQSVPASIYAASYPCWFMNEEHLLSLARDNNYSLVSCFNSLDKLDESATWKGHIFSLERK